MRSNSRLWLLSLCARSSRLNNKLISNPAVLALVILAFIWGYNWVVMKKVLAFCGLFDFAGLRTFFGALVRGAGVDEKTAQAGGIQIHAAFGLAANHGIYRAHHVGGGGRRRVPPLTWCARGLHNLPQRPLRSTPAARIGRWSTRGHRRSRAIGRTSANPASRQRCTGTGRQRRAH